MRSEEYLNKMEQYKRTMRPELVQGEVYWDKKKGEAVEFCYMGTDYAIVCEPGDSGGGMQSCWGLKHDDLETLTEKHVKQMQKRWRDKHGIKP
jgi:hypothetical protein